MVVVVILFHSLVSPIVSTIYIFILLSNALSYCKCYWYRFLFRIITIRV